MHLRNLFLLAAAVLLPWNAAFADELSLSVGAFATQSEYKGADTRVLPMPVIQYEGNRFFLKNAEAGVYVWSDERQRLSAGLTLLPLYLRTGKCDNQAMKQLDNRNIIVLGTLGYELETEYGRLRLTASGDVTGTSDGFLASAVYAYPLRRGALTLTPNAGVIFASSDFNDYYYGVSHAEAARSGFSHYDPEASFTPFLGVAANYRLSDHWSLFATWKITFLSDEVKDSPMVDRDTQHIFGGGITYSF